MTVDFNPTDRRIFMVDTAAYDLVLKSKPDFMSAIFLYQTLGAVLAHTTDGCITLETENQQRFEYTRPYEPKFLAFLGNVFEQHSGQLRLNIEAAALQPAEKRLLQSDLLSEVKLVRPTAQEGEKYDYMLENHQTNEVLFQQTPEAATAKFLLDGLGSVNITTYKAALFQKLPYDKNEDKVKFQLVTDFETALQENPEIVQRLFERHNFIKNYDHISKPDAAAQDGSPVKCTLAVYQNGGLEIIDSKCSLTRKEIADKIITSYLDTQNKIKAYPLDRSGKLVFEGKIMDFEQACKDFPGLFARKTLAKIQRDAVAKVK